MGLSLGHLIVILIIVLVLFGAGKLPSIMGDVARGIKAFKNQMDDEDKSKDDKKPLL
jgi:sec-independent protein translocase protein TatA